MTSQSEQPKIRISMMNVVHDLSVLVARDAGLFREEGLDVEVIETAGTARANPVGTALHTKIFDRSLESLYNGGGLDQYRMCEWGVMKRTVEAVQSGQRPAKIVALGAAMTRMAIVTFPDSGIYEPEQLKDRPIAVSPYNGSHFTTLKMLEGFIEKSHIQVTHAGTMLERIEAVRRGEVAAANVMEPWISVVQKQGFRVIMESNSTRAEAASDDLDGPTLAAMFRAQTRAAALINADPAQYAHYFVVEAKGLLEPQELQTWRLLYGPPAPYTRERFQDTYRWMQGYPNLVAAGATYEEVVDNRAWQ
jgi:NitT/TauT family transport system substrate-binding protein